MMTWRGVVPKENGLPRMKTDKKVRPSPRLLYTLFEGKWISRKDPEELANDNGIKMLGFVVEFICK